MKIEKTSLIKYCENIKYSILESLKNDQMTVDETYEALEFINAIENDENLEVIDNA